jgi:antitoxin (DNA-binding transcriptional repressor) of toxin-antitoxin stability system
VTIIVRVEKALDRLPELVQRACRGEEVLIEESGSVVRLVPTSGPAQRLRPLGSEAGKIVIHDNFDDPLPEEFLEPR